MGTTMETQKEEHSSMLVAMAVGEVEEVGVEEVEVEEHKVGKEMLRMACSPLLLAIGLLPSTNVCILPTVPQLRPSVPLFPPISMAYIPV
jgi:hypothetical protein